MIDYDREKYHVRSDGTIVTYWRAPFNKLTGMREPRVLSTYAAAGNGYPTVRLWKDGRRKGYQVHRLVAQEWLPPKPFDDAILRHLDGDRENTHMSNLAWGTQKENCADMRRHRDERIAREEQDADAQPV